MAKLKKVDIFWSLLDGEASSIFYEPANNFIKPVKKHTSKAASFCPAIMHSRLRTFSIKCPFDLRLRAVENGNGLSIHYMESGSSITFQKLSNLIAISPERDWLCAKQPIVQITTPYLFTSSSVAYLTQRHPYELIGKGEPFRLIEGRFPIHKWTRPLSWALEWVNIKKDLIIKRGQPWFDVTFELDDPEYSIELVSRPFDEILKKEVRETSEVTGYIKGTFKLFEEK